MFLIPVALSSAELGDFNFPRKKTSVNAHSEISIEWKTKMHFIKKSQNFLSKFLNSLPIIPHVERNSVTSVFLNPISLPCTWGMQSKGGKLTKSHFKVYEREKAKYASIIVQVYFPNTIFRWGCKIQMLTKSENAIINFPGNRCHSSKTNYWHHDMVKRLGISALILTSHWGSSLHEWPSELIQGSCGHSGFGLLPVENAVGFTFYKRLKIIQEKCHNLWIL